jgi:hypothetical protein
MGTKEITTPETINSVPICRTCGSERVAKDAWACFNRQSGLWELETVFDAAHCHKCEVETKLDWVLSDALQNQRVRELNDRFRSEGLGNGSVMITPGIQEFGGEEMGAIMNRVHTFDTFTDDNDPWKQHDFGAFDHAGQKVFWKIDCYDTNCEFGSENPANEALTHRVLTIMLASEY